MASPANRDSRFCARTLRYSSVCRQSAVSQDVCSNFRCNSTALCAVRQNHRPSVASRRRQRYGTTGLPSIPSAFTCSLRSDGCNDELAAVTIGKYHETSSLFWTAAIVRFPQTWDSSCSLTSAERGSKRHGENSVYDGDKTNVAGINMLNLPLPAGAPPHSTKPASTSNLCAFFAHRACRVAWHQRGCAVARWHNTGKITAARRCFAPARVTAKVVDAGKSVTVIKY